MKKSIKNESLGEIRCLLTACIAVLTFGCQDPFYDDFVSLNCSDKFQLVDRHFDNGTGYGFIIRNAPKIEVFLNGIIDTTYHPATLLTFVKRGDTIFVYRDNVLTDFHVRRSSHPPFSWNEYSDSTVSVLSPLATTLEIKENNEFVIEYGHYTYVDDEFGIPTFFTALYDDFPPSFPVELETDSIKHGTWEPLGEDIKLRYLDNSVDDAVVVLKPERQIGGNPNQPFLKLTETTINHDSGRFKTVLTMYYFDSDLVFQCYEGAGSDCGCGGF